MIDKLIFKAAIDHPELIASSVYSLLQNLSEPSGVEDILVAEIDPLVAGGFDFCHKYNIPFTEGANCLRL